ncbi:MAG: ABC transporter permease [Anaerolineae bacterium]|nr:ABC transporter permease [Anaerolineae bacterium]
MLTTTKPSTIQILFALIQADTIVLWRQRKSVVMSLALPLIFLIAWRGIATRVGGAFVIGTCITVGLVGIGVLSYPNLVARDRERGVFQRLRTAPIPAWTLMVSRLLIQLFVIWIMSCLILIGANLLDHISISPTSVILVLILAVLAGSIFLAIGQALVGLISASDSVNASARILSLPIIFIGALGALGNLGDTVKVIVMWSPFGIAQSLIQFALAPSTWDGQIGVVVLLAVFYVALFAGIGIRWFKWHTV